jgi:hypothetical protein
MKRRAFIASLGAAAACHSWFARNPAQAADHRISGADMGHRIPETAARIRLDRGVPSQSSFGADAHTERYAEVAAEFPKPQVGVISTPASALTAHDQISLTRS